MQLAVIGFPLSGKSTVFKALTGGKGEMAKGGKAALGMVKVPDERLDALAAIYKPKKYTPAEIVYVDMPSAAGFGSGKGIEGQFLNDLNQADALVQVVGAYQDGVGIPMEGAHYQKEVRDMEMELSFSDLAILERRLQRLEAQKKSARQQDRDQAQKETVLLGRIKASLEAEVPIRELDLSEDDSVLLRNYQFLTAKPLVFVLNISEEQLPQAEALEKAASEEGRRKAIAVCGTLEAELATMDAADAEEFMKDAGIEESSLRRMVNISYDTLGLISFLTAGEDEVRAWSIPMGTPAPKAAGKIHSDIERGFIRAEVVAYDDFMACNGSMAEARKRGVLRAEGKGYVVKDGDIINFLFNV
jgi:GTP-binding protein YchF